jgi:hypothetical protein
MSKRNFDFIFKSKGVPSVVLPEPGDPISKMICFGISDARID